MNWKKTIDEFIFRISAINRDNFSDAEVVMEKARNEVKALLEKQEKEIIKRIKEAEKRAEKLNDKVSMEYVKLFLETLKDDILSALKVGEAK